MYHKLILAYSFSLTNINVSTQYRVVYYSILIIIYFVYSGVYTYSILYLHVHSCNDVVC